MKLSGIREAKDGELGRKQENEGKHFFLLRTGKGDHVCVNKAFDAVTWYSGGGVRVILGI